MMFTHYVLVLLPAAFSLASASTLRKDGPAVPPRAVCWSGGIHSPCNGAANGCTYDGILVTCQNSTGAMVYSSMCGCCESKGTCTYDANCNASCAA